MPKVYFWNGVQVDTLTLNALSSGAAFDMRVFTRMRYCRISNGRFLLVAGRQHVKRVLHGVRLFAGPDILQLEDTVVEWLTQAIRCADFDTDGYIHLEVGLAGDNPMAEDARGGVYVAIAIDQKPAMYAGQVHLSTQVRFPRPDGPGVGVKHHGNYPDLMRARLGAIKVLGDRQPETPRGSREGLLLAREEFRRGILPGQYELATGADPLVAEAAFSNLGHFDRHGNVRIPDPLKVPYFTGLTVQIVHRIVEGHLKKRFRRVPLRRSELLRDGFTTGTAGYVTPIISIDGQPVEHSGSVSKLAELYQQFCRGELDNPRIMEEFAFLIDP